VLVVNRNDALEDLDQLATLVALTADNREHDVAALLQTLEPDEVFDLLVVAIGSLAALVEVELQ
jgi:hypothetical protein